MGDQPNGQPMLVGAFGHSGGGRGGGPVGSFLPPSLYALQHHVEAPYLDPRKKDTWVHFERTWGEWSKYQLYGTPEGPVGDIMRRDLLLTRVHPILRE